MLNVNLRGATGHFTYYSVTGYWVLFMMHNPFICLGQLSLQWVLLLTGSSDWWGGLFSFSPTPEFAGEVSCCTSSHSFNIVICLSSSIICRAFDDLFLGLIILSLLVPSAAIIIIFYMSPSTALYCMVMVSGYINASAVPPYPKSWWGICVQQKFIIFLKAFFPRGVGNCLGISYAVSLS